MYIFAWVHSTTTSFCWLPTLQSLIHFSHSHIHPSIIIMFTHSIDSWKKKVIVFLSKSTYLVPSTHATSEVLQPETNVTNEWSFQWCLWGYLWVFCCCCVYCNSFYSLRRHFFLVSSSEFFSFRFPLMWLSAYPFLWLLTSILVRNNIYIFPHPLRTFIFAYTFKWSNIMRIK